MAKVLVAEDDLAVRELVTFVLDSCGHTVLVCTDGRTALSTARAEQPDLAILDISMPGLSGLQVCRELRSETRTEALPVMILTAHGQWVDVTSGFEAGADDYLVKPFSPTILLERVDTLLMHDDEPARLPAAGQPLPTNDS